MKSGLTQGALLLAVILYAPKLIRALTSITCGDDMRSDGVSLQCPGGHALRLRYVNYGRTDITGDVCPYHSNHVLVDDCYSDKHVEEYVKGLCDDKNSCGPIIRGDLEMGDPCVGTYKYMEIHYICARDSHEYRLQAAIVGDNSRYDRFIRPVRSPADAVTVSFGLSLIKILNVDEYKGILEAQYWLRHVWTDENLKWNPSEFGGLDQTRMEISWIWSPDIMLFNGLSETDYNDALAVVSSNGQVLWIPSVTLKSHCDFNSTDNPLDTQMCKLKFGSWTYDGNKIDVDFYDDLEAIDTGDYIPHSEWQLGDCDATKNVKYYACCEEPYPSLTFNLVMQRNNARFLRERRCNACC